ncbi:hypothetical protein LguiA_012036 [Lonicera macranthoides]
MVEKTTSLIPFLSIFGTFLVTLFSSSKASRKTFALVNTRIDWKEIPQAHVFKADLPGIKKEEVKVEVEDDRFRLPENAKMDKIKASMENGVLTVTIPKEELWKPDVNSIAIFVSAKCLTAPNSIKNNIDGGDGQSSEDTIIAVPLDSYFNGIDYNLDNGESRLDPNGRCEQPYELKPDDDCLVVPDVSWAFSGAVAFIASEVLYLSPSSFQISIITMILKKSPKRKVGRRVEVPLVGVASELVASELGSEWRQS